MPNIHIIFYLPRIQTNNDSGYEPKIRGNPSKMKGRYHFGRVVDIIGEEEAKTSCPISLFLMYSVM